MVIWRCEICGFQSPNYNDVWWHVRLDHNIKRPSEKISMLREPREGLEKMKV